MSKVNATVATELNELKTLIEENNNKLNSLENKISANHNDLMAKITVVEAKTNEAFTTTKRNEAIISDLLKLEENLPHRIKEKIDIKIPEIKESVKNNININRIEIQMNGILIELNELRNRSMRSNLIIRGIPEQHNGKWENTSQILANFISDNLNLSFTHTHSEIDMQISRGHRSNDKNDSRNDRKNQPRPIIAQFVNWRVAEEIPNCIIHLNATRKSKITANQMFSKDLAARRDRALMKRREHLNENKNHQVKLEFPATLKYQIKGSNAKWSILETF